MCSFSGQTIQWKTSNTRSYWCTPNITLAYSGQFCLWMNAWHANVWLNNGAPMEHGFIGKLVCTHKILIAHYNFLCVGNLFDPYPCIDTSCTTATWAWQSIDFVLICTTHIIQDHFITYSVTLSRLSRFFSHIKAVMSFGIRRIS